MTEELLCCPITGEKMKDPVVDPEGNSFERDAILDWLSRNPTSPITRAPLQINQLIPNRALLDLIHADDNNDNKTRTRMPCDANQQCLLQGTRVHLKATYNKQNQALIQVQVSDDATEARPSTSLVCVIDESYSMDSPATIDGDAEGLAGLSLLDIVKHATRTIIETLGHHDKLAIVAYSNTARTVLPFVPMTPANRIHAREAVAALRTNGSTNLWDGLKHAMDIALSENLPNTNIILLTDGRPNIHPPRGELPSLIRYKESHPDMKCSISTFGFGYNLDSELLNDIAVEGGGRYGFIPDSSFVGTVFINAAASILATAVSKAKLVLQNANGAKILRCLSGQASVSTSCGLSIDLPSLQYGQTFDVLVQLDSSSPNASPFTAFFESSEASLCDEVGVDAMFADSGYANVQIEVVECRSKVIRFIRVCQGRFKSSGDAENLRRAQADLEELLNEIKSFSDTAMQHGLSDLMKDLKGQISEAYSRIDWYRKWGRHYVPSLARAHELQICTNFKDPGLQGYATRKFSLIRDAAEDLFCKLPPPKPSLAQRGGNTNYRPVQSMSTYHDSNALCFAAGDVRLMDGRCVPVSDVVAGDRIIGPGGPAKVICVVATACSGGMEQLVELEEGVWVTPWHPVRPKGTTQWQFPCDIGEATSRPCNWVYSFVLEGGASAFDVGSFEAVSLGHGIEDDSVAMHPYLGSSLVVKDLSVMRGYNEGLVKLDPNPAIRDPRSGNIVSLRQHLPDINEVKAPSFLVT